METVVGVLVDVLGRTKYGVRLGIEGGKIKSIERVGDVSEPYILPGFIDSHVHIESSMLIPSRFADMALRHGTIAAIVDPHEVANVAGVGGIEFMVQNAKLSEMGFFFGVPSCVPASPFEKSGAVLDSGIVGDLLARDDYFFLAEMMNYPGVVYNDKEVLAKLAAAKKYKKPVDGHAPDLKGEQLRAYVGAGVSTDHECSTLEEAKDKIALGMKILIREGSAAKNFETLSPLIDMFPDKVMLCTDDCHPDYLQMGHINKIVRRAVKGGTDIFNALRAATINPILHYNLPLGQLRVGDYADFVIVKDLEEFEPLKTVIRGKEVWSAYDKTEEITKEQLQEPPYTYRKTLPSGCLKLIAQTSRMNAIQAIDGELLTKRIVIGNLVEGSEVISNIEEDILKIVLLDRYSEDKPIVAFIKGFGLKSGAIAGSIAHDSHHILAVGTNDFAIESSLQWVIESKGGICFSSNQGDVLGIKLPFFGLMCNEPGESISVKYENINKLVKENGCQLHSPFMTMAFMALTVIPEVKIYHKGLFNGLEFKHLNQFI